MEERRESFVQPENELLSASNTDMHDFSISSLISNVSKLLEGNNSSFLVHVDSRRVSDSSGLSYSANTKRSKELSRSFTPEMSGSNSRGADDILVPVTPTHRKLGQPDSEKCHVITHNAKSNSTNSNQQREDSSLKFSMADIISKVEQQNAIPNTNNKIQPHFVEELPTSSAEYKTQEDDAANRFRQSHSSIDETDTLLADLLKDLKNPLLSRRFPPPTLSAIFERSCEDISLHSRSRASSVSSSKSQKKVSTQKVNISEHPPKLPKGPGPTAVTYQTNHCSTKSNFRILSTKTASKIPIPFPTHPPQTNRLNFDSGILPSPFLVSTKPDNNSGFIRSCNSIVSTTNELSSTEMDLQKIGDTTIPSVAEWMNHPSIRHDDIEIEYQRCDEPDSWNEFDKIMDKSLPPKEWEIHEFEELVTEQKNKSVLVENNEELSFVCVSSEDARLLMDKEEEDRAQFLKSSNVSFASVGDSLAPAPRIDIFSMTNYFQMRSSFPIDNQANESSMFHDDYTARQEDLEPSLLTNNDSVGKDLTITPNFITNTMQLDESNPLSSSQSQSPSMLIKLDSKTKNLARFLMGSESNGIQKNSIMEHVLEMCKRQSISNLSISETPNQLKPNASVNQEMIENKQKEIQFTSANVSSAFQPAKSIEKRKEIDQPITDATNSAKSKQHLPNGTSQSENKQTPLKKSSFRVPSIPSIPPFKPPRVRVNKVKFSGDGDGLNKDSNSTINNGDEIDASIMLSEHGKAAFMDDVDPHGKNEYDEFYRHLACGNPAKSERLKSLKATKTMKENTCPTVSASAFAPLPALNVINSREIENPRTKSVEILRRSASSPPEKLVSLSSKLCTPKAETYQPAQNIAANNALHQNHSTPITTEPLSVQLAKAMSRDDTFFTTKPSTPNEPAVNVLRDNNSRHSTENNVQSSRSEPLVKSSTVRNSSTPNDFEHRDVLTSTKNNGAKQRHSDNRMGNASYRSVEVARNNRSKQTTQSCSSQENPGLIAKYSIEEKAEPCPIESSKKPPSVSLSTASATQFHSTHSSVPCGHQNLQEQFPPPYGFPVSIHIHLPAMPYMQQHYQPGQGQTLGYPSSNIVLSNSDTRLTNPCNCQLPGHANKMNS